MVSFQGGFFVHAAARISLLFDNVAMQVVGHIDLIFNRELNRRKLGVVPAVNQYLLPLGTNPFFLDFGHRIVDGLRQNDEVSLPRDFEGLLDHVVSKGVFDEVC